MECTMERTMECYGMHFVMHFLMHYVMHYVMRASGRPAPRRSAIEAGHLRLEGGRLYMGTPDQTTTRTVPYNAAHLLALSRLRSSSISAAPPSPSTWRTGRGIWASGCSRCARRHVNHYVMHHARRYVMHYLMHCVMHHVMHHNPP